MTVTLRITTTGLAAGLTTIAAILALTAKVQLLDTAPPEAPPIEISTPRDETPPPEKRIVEPRPITPSEPIRTEPLAPFAPPIERIVPETTGFPLPPSSPPVITAPRWIERPNAADFGRRYPARARERGREGRVVLDCIVAANGRIGCSVAEETPAGWGFGDAALQISEAFRMSPRLENGQPTEGGLVRVPITFRLE